MAPSLAGNGRISIICTINPEVSAVAGSTNTLQFAQRTKRALVRCVYLHDSA